MRTAASHLLRCLPGDSSVLGPPRRVSLTARDWFKRLDPRDTEKHRYHAIEGARHTTRVLPKHADEPIARLFNNMVQATVQDQFVVELSGGRYWGRAAGYAIAPDDTLLADISPVFDNWGKPIAHAQSHDGYKQPLLPPLQLVRGSVLSLNTLYCSNYHHFLLDTAPKVELVRRSGLSVRDFDKIVFDYQATPYQNEILERLQIPIERIVPSTPNLHIQADRLVVPSYSEPGARVDSFDYTPEGLQFVRQLFLAEQPPQKRRILLSRRLAATRRWLYEEAALDRLKALGFERFELERLPVAEQARLFSEAECVLMPHGGGLANCVFCQPNTKVIELFNPNYLPTFMMPLSSSLSLEYHALVGKAHPLDIAVPADRVVDYLKSIL